MARTPKEALDAQIKKAEKRVIELGDKYQSACDELHALREKRKAIDHDELIAAYVKSGKSHSEVMAFLLGGASGEDDQMQEEPSVKPKRRGRPRKNSAEPL